MKNKFVLIIAIVCLAFSQTFAQKTGYLNTNDLLVLMPEVKHADTLLAQYADELNKIYSGYVVEYQNKLADYQKNGSTWSDVKKEVTETDLGNMQTRISDFEDDSQNKISAKKEELYGPILDKVKVAIKKVGDDNKFTTILDGSSLLYVGSDAIDVLPLVKKQLGIQ